MIFKLSNIIPFKKGEEMTDKNLPPVFRVPSKWHYFEYGICSENMLSGFIADAESYGCEFQFVVPGMMPLKQSVITNGRQGPQMVPVVKVWVRCIKADFPSIHAELQKAAKAEASQGLRHGLQ